MRKLTQGLYGKGIVLFLVTMLALTMWFASTYRKSEDVETIKALERRIELLERQNQLLTDQCELLKQVINDILRNVT